MTANCPFSFASLLLSPLPLLTWSQNVVNCQHAMLTSLSRNHQSRPDGGGIDQLFTIASTVSLMSSFFAEVSDAMLSGTCPRPLLPPLAQQRAIVTRGRSYTPLADRTAHQQTRTWFLRNVILAFTLCTSCDTFIGDDAVCHLFCHALLFGSFSFLQLRL